jgi:DNA gyrase subunit A
MVKDDSISLKEFDRIAKSKAMVEKKLIEELRSVGDQITALVKQKDQERQMLEKKIEKVNSKKNTQIKKIKH